MGKNRVGIRVRVWLVLGCSGLMGGVMQAQQLPQGTLYTMNPYVVNPALSGAYDFADVRLSYRRQWQGLDDAPNTAYITAHTPVGFGDKITGAARTPRYAGGTTRFPAPPVGTWRWGAGMVLLADRTGPTERNIGQLTGAAHVSLPGEWQLSVGLGAGVLQYVLRFDRIQTANPSDPILPAGRVSQLKPYFSAGLLARKGNFWGGASVLSPTAVSLSYATPSGVRLPANLFPTTTSPPPTASNWRRSGSCFSSYGSKKPVPHLLRWMHRYAYSMPTACGEASSIVTKIAWAACWVWPSRATSRSATPTNIPYHPLARFRPEATKSY
ncbi:type IX secretion system membrane protein PorP/SprF [Cytophagaceae bacterium SJW1-29]|uniref:Type IX secretion system membrane protein PorP/SprF n=1 Tax=Salmonirosea aquatica TaxID=2654236 RepID=A0A7C9FR96_9BACT|nr:type IX secretion system membrane protein PorP/SprF [Cytophagaceae bacterium SJW1-29]